MLERYAKALTDRLASRLGRTRLSVAAAMVVERGWPLVLPPLLVGSLFLSLSWLGFFRHVPDWARLAALAVLALCFAAVLLPLRAFRRPSAAEIDRRIERANELAHTPVLVQSDRPSGAQSSFADALWREHQRRMAVRLDRLAGDLPRTHIPERDPWGIRAAAALLLVTAFAFSFGPFGGRLGDGFRPGAGLAVLPPRIDAWVTPPAYTGKAPVFLTADASQQPAPALTVPEGSELALRVTGGSGEETLSFTDADGNVRDLAPRDPAAGVQNAEDAGPAAETAAAAAVRQFAGRLAADGVATLRSGATVLQEWSFTVTPDQPPVIRFVGEPKRAVNGALELAYEIVDDYGAASAQAVFELETPPPGDAHPLYGAPEMKLPLPRRGAKNAGAKASQNLTEHVWAGSAIRLRLKAVDAAGQEAVTEPKALAMPEHPFTNPIARAVVEMRKIFSLDTRQRRDVLELVDAVTLRPEDTFKTMSNYLGIMLGRTKLVMAADDDQLRAVSDYFWEMALAIEDGDLSAAEKRLRQAQEALKQALENGASDEEIEKLMAELRQAMDEFLREFAERAQRDPNMAQSPQNGQEMRQSDLERMMDQIEEMAKSGNREQAQDLLAHLQEMMNNLQAGRQQQGQQGQQNSEMRQQMDKLGEIMRRQQETMNETFRLDQMQRGEQQGGEEGGEQNGRNGEPGDQDRQGRGMTPEEFAEAMRQLQEGQGRLQSELEALTKGLEGMGIQPGEGFGEAGEAMGEAEGSLGRGEGERAVGEQGRALEALRKGAQDMMQQMQQAMQGEQGGGEEGGRQQNADRDPLGRPRATSGPDFGDSVAVPDEIDVQRARRILEAIRKRLGNALSPELERSYLERLLDLR